MKANLTLNPLHAKTNLYHIHWILAVDQQFLAAGVNNAMGMDRVEVQPLHY